MDTMLLIFLVGICLGIGLVARALPATDAAWWKLAGLAGLLAVAGAAQGGWGGVVLLAAAELAAVALVWRTGTAEAREAARLYLLAIVPAIALTAAGLALAGGAPPGPAGGKLAVALLATGFALKLGLFPFYFWLPRVVAGAATMTGAFVVAVLGIAGFAELIHLRTHAPWIFDEHRAIWAAIAVLSMFGGGLLALAQHDLKRLLAFSSIEDLGFLLLGLTLGGAAGVSGAWLGALSHGLAKFVLFGAVAVAERGLGQAVSFDRRGLAARFPLAGAAFVVGALGFIGVPPAFGFVGRCRLYLAGAQEGPLMLATMVAASALELLIYARVIHRIWLGTPDAARAASPRARDPASAVLAAATVAALLCGLFPGVLFGGDGGALTLIAAAAHR